MIRVIILLAGTAAGVAAFSLATGHAAACDKANPSRFAVTEGVAYDQKTKLTWRRCSEGLIWQGAKCTGEAQPLTLPEAKLAAARAGDGWRLPTIDELYGLVEPKCQHPTIDAQVFPDVKESDEGAPYWTSSEVPGMPEMFYYVDFAIGFADGHSAGLALGVRLVKDGQ